MYASGRDRPTVSPVRAERPRRIGPGRHPDPGTSRSVTPFVSSRREIPASGDQGAGVPCSWGARAA